jgi:hypothetical protein
MVQQVIDVGTSASDGTGDPLRDAFTKINDNFTELYTTVENEGLTYGNVASNVTGITFNVTRFTESYSAAPVLKGTGQVIGNVYVIRGNVLGGSTPINDVYLTVTTLANVTVGNIATVSASGVPIAPVLRVNGLTGNVTLTVNNIDGAASKAYVNAAISANIANVTGSVTDSLNANITAANAVISNHAARITTLESNAATQATAITNLTNIKANIAYVDTSISLALSSNAILANVAAVNANVAAANSAILLRANLSGALFTGNITANNITAVNHVYTEFLNVGDQSVPAYFDNRGGSFVGNTVDFYGVYLQNQNSAGTGDYLVFPDGLQTTENYVALGVAGTSYSNIRYPGTKPRDSYVYAVGGNLYLESETHAVQMITANVVRMEIQQSGTVKVLSNITFADGTIQTTAFGGNINLSQVNANVAAANVAIASLQSNAASQALNLDSLTTNAASHAANINTLNSNAAVQATAINSLNANIGSFQIFSNTNAATQSTSISLLNANVTAANLNITTIIANAATQSLELSNLQSNAQAQQGNIIALQTNAATQSSQIDLLNANVTAANTNITTLTANSATQAVQINLLNANLTASNLNIASLSANAASQALDINNLYANVNFYLSNVASSNANIAAANARIIIIDANLGSTATNVSTLQSNAATQAVQIDLLNANVTAANSAIATKANINGAIFSGNVQAAFLLANANVKIGSTLEVGNTNPITYPGLGGVFVGNTDGYYQVVVQNTNNGASASGDFVITADDGTDENKYMNIGINSSGFAGNFTVPAGDTRLTEFPYDGYFTVIGGNAAIRSDNGVFFAANTSLAGLLKDGNFFINSNLSVTGAIVSNTISISGNLTVGNINTLGQIDYLMGNALHWNSVVSNVAAALDQIAARLYALENP